jgi:peptidoglycan/LPS O-acetylase OafA/YrhL
MPFFSEAAPEGPRSSSLIPWLEMMRGLASLQVFFGHLFIIFLFNDLTLTNRPFWIEAFLTWSGEAVLIFFVLSGLVIALSQARQSRGRSSFIRARLRRLLPLYLVVVLISFLVDSVLGHRLYLKPIWGHLLFLQSWNVKSVPLFRSNPPLWSLSFEMYFYLLYSLTLGSLTWVRSTLWLSGFLFMAMYYFGFQFQGIFGHLETIIAYMPIWLLGVTLIRNPIYFKPSLDQNIVIFSMMFLVARSYSRARLDSPVESFILALFIAPLLYSLANPQNGSNFRTDFRSWLLVGGLYVLAVAKMMVLSPYPESDSYRTASLFWISIPPFIAILVSMRRLLAPVPGVIIAAWRNVSLFLGRISYALYVIHMPVFTVVHEGTRSVPVRLVLDIGLTFPLACFLEYKVHPYLCRKFDRAWPRSAAAGKT